MKLHNEFFNDIGDFIRYSKTKNPLFRLLYATFENDLWTARHLVHNNKKLNDEVKKLGIIFKKIEPQLIKMNIIMGKVRKISPKK